MAGFKYFKFKGCGKVEVEVEGSAWGKMVVRDGLDGETVAEIALFLAKGRKEVFFSELNIEDGVNPLYFTFCGKGKLNFHAVIFE